jgi:hypothetical protein
VAAGQLDFMPPNFMSVSLSLNVHEPISSGVALSGLYRLAGPDSATFPFLTLTPELFLKVSPTTVTLVTQPSSNSPSPAAMLGGAHRFVFTRQE